MSQARKSKFCLSHKTFFHQTNKPKKNFPQKHQQAQQGVYPQLAYMPRPHSYQRNYHQAYFAFRRPSVPKTQPRPEPMEIDSSMRSKRGQNAMTIALKDPQAHFQPPHKKYRETFILMLITCQKKVAIRVTHQKEVMTIPVQRTENRTIFRNTTNKLLKKQPLLKIKMIHLCMLVICIFWVNELFVD